MIAAVVNLLSSPGTHETTDVESDVEHVVVLCQEARVRDLVASWLSHGKFDVVVADTGANAYFHLFSGHQRNRYVKQTLITDRVFPPWPGIGSISQLKQKLRGLRVIVVQDGSHNAGAVAQAAGADAGIQRPLHRNELFAVLAFN